MGLAYVKVFVDWLDALEEYGDAERGRLFTALLEYGKTGEAKKLSGNEKYVFPIMRNAIDRQMEEYEVQCGRNRTNGSKGGRPKKPTQTQENRVGFEKPTQTQEEEKEEDKEKEKEEEYILESSNEDSLSPPEAATRQMIDYKAIVEDYNRTCTRLSSCRSISDSRRKAIAARLNTYTSAELHQLFVRAQRSDFLCGRNQRNWKADFNWLINAANAEKVLEGKYDNRDAQQPDAPLESWEQDWMNEFQAMSKQSE